MMRADGTHIRLTQPILPVMDKAMVTARLLRIESDLVNLIHTADLSAADKDKLRLALTATGEVRA